MTRFMHHLWRQVGWHRLVVDVSGSIKLCDRHLVSVHKPMLPSVPLPTLAAPPPPRSLPAPTRHISRAYF